MRMASDSSLWIPATMWQSLSCGMTLLSAMDFIPSVQSFPSRALTTAGQGIIHSHIKCTYPASSTANTWSEYQQKILSRHKHPGRLRRSQLYCGYCYWSSFTINFTKRRSVLLFQGTYSNRHNIIRLFSSCYFFCFRLYLPFSIFRNNSWSTSFKFFDNDSTSGGILPPRKLKESFEWLEDMPRCSLTYRINR